MQHITCALTYVIIFFVLRKQLLASSSFFPIVKKSIALEISKKQSRGGVKAQQSIEVRVNSKYKQVQSHAVSAAVLLPLGTH